MPEVSGNEFFKSATTTEPNTSEFKLADSQNRYITLTLEEVERKDLFDELNRLPDGFIDILVGGAEGDAEDLSDVDDPEDIDTDMDNSEVFKSLDGTVIDVFEQLFVLGASHEDLTSLDMEELATNLGFEVLFEVGGEVIDLSLADEDEIKRFREPDSDKSS